MSRLPCCLFAILLIPMCAAPLNQAHPKPPGIATGDTLANHPLEPPSENRNKKIDLDQVKRESEELRKLADSLPDQIQQVAAGQIPKDLPENLKRIEKLAKHLHGEIVP
jgi:hypothetical protein